MNDEADYFNAFLEIHAGAGGTESQDWAQILQRMYVDGLSHKILKLLYYETRGEEAGIKSCIIKISNEFSYGWLKKESGIHRLVKFLHLIAIKEDILVLQVYGFIQKLMIRLKSK